jgi:hypothetical protein
MTVDLGELRDQITEYYQTYYSELRSQLANHELVASETIPESLRGYRRIVTVLGKDGVIVTHWPDMQDFFDFHISPERMVKDLAAEQCGGERIIDYPPGSDFGIYEINEPLQLTVDDQVVWVAPWQRLDVSSRLNAWQNRDRARKAAKEDLARYVAG